MEGTIDSFVALLQEHIHEEMQEAYGEIAYERWRNLCYQGSLIEPDGYACLQGSCDDMMEIFLKFDDNRVVEASYRTGGCGSSSVCGSFTAELALGKSAEEIARITADDIRERVGGLPRADEHCATLAAKTLQKAVNDYMRKQTGE